MEKIDGRKADYTDRPLTEEEKVFAADWKNYDQLFKYMAIYHLDPEEWYDVLALQYLQAVKKYFSIPKLRSLDFGAVLFKTLDSKRSNTYASWKREKYNPLGGLLSLDYVLEEAENNSCNYMWTDRTQHVEQDALDNMKLLELLKKLTEIQQEIVTMLLEGYGKEEVRNLMGISIRSYKREMKCIKCIVADYLSM